ncbi:MAG: Gfo/Idh/MocA family oxidoreductase [Polyangiaceae bacterium]
MTHSNEPTPLLRVLHVGVGNRGLWPIELCTPQTGFVPAALCDVDPAALEAARDKTGLGSEVCFARYEEALERSDVDCVIICAPTIFHVPYVSLAIERGLPVLTEKGMSPDWAGARRVVELARKKNAKACVAQNYRYNAMERTIGVALSDPSHPAHPGPVHLVCYTQQRVRPLPRTLVYPFASIWDMSCHHFDNLLYWFGPIDRMSAFSWGASWSAYEHDNNTSGHLVFKNQIRGHYIHTHDAARAGLEIQIHGERGALWLANGRLTFSQRPLEQFGERPLEPVPLVQAAGEADLLRDFHAYVTRGVEPGVSARHNLETMAACEMMVRSIGAGRTATRAELEVER